MDRPLTEDDKKKIYELLAESYIRGMETTGLTRNERSLVAQDILENVQKIKTFNELYVYVDGLAKRYAFFSLALNKLKEQVYKAKEQVVIGKLTNYINQVNKN